MNDQSGVDFLLPSGDAGLTASYALDISSPSGCRNQVSGIDLDSSGNFPLAKSELSPGETNFLRIRMEDGAGTPYSRNVSIAYDDAVTAASPNQIRSLSVGRSGTDLVVRWNLLEENGKPTLITFTRADTGVSDVVSPGPLAPGTTALTLDSQALGTPCGSFSGSQRESDGSMTDSSVYAQIGVLDPGGLCTNPGDPPPPGDEGLVFNETFHHRDHLGSLRVATDGAGWPVMNGRLDYYPFGMRMDTGLPDATRRHYTGHEHDPDTGLEYMLARYGSTGKGRFLAVDPARDVSAAVPVSWNRYAYVRNNPVGSTDPTGTQEENQATPVTGEKTPNPDDPLLGDSLTERGSEGQRERAAAEQERAANADAIVGDNRDVAAMLVGIYDLATKPAAAAVGREYSGAVLAKPESGETKRMMVEGKEGGHVSAQIPEIKREMDNGWVLVATAHNHPASNPIFPDSSDYAAVIELQGLERSDGSTPNVPMTDYIIGNNGRVDRFRPGKYLEGNAHEIGFTTVDHLRRALEK